MKYDQLKEFIDSANSVVIVQADNPDGDSLGSSLALESLLEDLGKKSYMYCGVEIPSYLRYMHGWDRVTSELPHDFDLSIIVDTSAISLLETLNKNQQINWIRSRKTIVIDHHKTEETIDFADLIINEEAVSTGELIFKISKSLNWNVNSECAGFIAYSILSDTLGLTSESVNSTTFRIMGELLEKGVSIAELDDARRMLSKKSARIVGYKGKLLQRIYYPNDSRLAFITIPWEEIEAYSHEYNPSMLVLDEMRMTEGVCVAIAFKTYPDGKITAKIRTNYGYKIANELAEHFGGGGHYYAAGFKLNGDRSIDDVKNECIKVATALLDKIDGDVKSETVQHTF